MQEIVVIVILVGVLASFSYAIWKISKSGDINPTIDTVARRGDLMPHRAHDTDAGADLRALHWAKIPVGQRQIINTGVAVEIPDGHVGLVFSRSGHGMFGVSLANSVGVIDSAYRGEIRVMIENRGNSPFEVNVGDRIAQMVVIPIVLPVFREVGELSPSDRGHAGFGSTGKK